MVFSSLTFLWVFLPVVLVLYYLLPQKFRNPLLIFASLLFYAWGEPKYIILMLVSVTVNYLSGLLLGKYRKYGKQILAGCVTVNLLLLGYFKYFAFLMSLLNNALAVFRVSYRLPIVAVALPIGISFYTFQALSYVIDVYRGETNVQKNYASMLLYVSFFPQLIAGPIVKYRDIEEQIRNRTVTQEDFAEGIRRFCIGLGKKVLLANTFAQVVDEVYQTPISDVTRKVLWFAALLYMLQIYYDFSGYSDMAIGLGRMFGFTFQENFNLPYTAVSVRDFWRRWHISLSSWFRDYVYIPLGGNRRGAVRTYVNLMIVFFITGLWHGAGTTFILWGLYHGLFLILERAFLGKWLDRLPAFVGRCYTLIVVFWGWILFRTESLAVLKDYVRNMFVYHVGSLNITAYMKNRILFCVGMGILFSGIAQSIWGWIRQRFPERKTQQKYSVTVIVGCLLLLWLSLMALVNDSYNPFIYFRF